MATTKVAKKTAKTTKVAKADKGAIVKAGPVELPVFGGVLKVSAERVEYNRLRERFEKLAIEQRDLAEESIDAAAENVDQFYQNGDAWAHQYIDTVGELAVEELMSKGCYDFDKETFLSKFLNAYYWNKRFKEFSEKIAAVDAEEAEREEARLERSHEAKNRWVGLTKEGQKEADWDNFTGGLKQGALNMVGRGIFALANASEKKDIFKNARDGLVRAIYLTVKTTVDELVDCLAANGHPLEGAKVDKESSEKAERLFNNLKTGKLPADAAEDAKMQILELDPYNYEFFEHVYVSDGDPSGELCATAEFFGYSLDSLKAQAFANQIGECPYETEEETLEYRKKAVALGEELRYEPTDKLAEIDEKLKEFDEKARTVDGRMFDTREEASKQRELSEFEAKINLDTEEAAIASKKDLQALIKKLGIDGAWKLERVDAALKKFDEIARTVDERIFDTREEASKQRELSEFEKQINLNTEQDAIASRKSLEAKIAELGIDGAWKLERVDAALKRFDEIARTTFGIMFDTREEAKNALEDRELFYKGIEKTISDSQQQAFYTGVSIPDKKIGNARAVFPIPADEYVLGLTDTTLFGSGKTGLAITKWGLRWKNGGSTPTNTSFIAWEDFANIPAVPTAEKDVITFADGARYANSGSNVDDAKMLDVITAIYGYCKAATFFVKKTAEELAAEEAGMSFRQKMERLMQPITDKDFLCGGRIPEKKLNKARSTCQVDADDTVLALIDSTLFGSAATALLLCEKGIYWHNKDSVGKCHIPWDKIDSLKSSICIPESGRLVFSQGNSFAAGSANVDLEKIKNLILEIGKLAVA